jgi:hypothetical protein
MEKVNLTIIDKNPDIKNFIYAGVPAVAIDGIKQSFKEGQTIEFIYDEGQVIVACSEVHTLVFSEYISMEEMENPSEEQS